MLSSAAEEWRQRSELQALLVRADLALVSCGLTNADRQQVEQLLREARAVVGAKKYGPKKRKPPADYRPPTRRGGS